ncbi:inverted formin-2-like isoform X1, partial [Biomphalaria pfeifferi]
MSQLRPAKQTSLRPASSAELGQLSTISSTKRPASAAVPSAAVPSTFPAQSSKVESGEKTSSGRFAAKKKQKRGKRGRSDGFVLGLDLANEEASETENNEETLKKTLDSESFNFIFWLRNPSLQTLSQLRKAIKCNDLDWMRCFLEFDGLGLLFQCLKNLSSYHSSHLNDMVLRMACVSCIREVVNSRSGLDCLLTIGDRNDNLFGRRFSTALETNNLIVKMQIFELLSALCLYSADGFYLTLDALERYKVWRKQKYRFSLLVNDLRNTDLTTYKTTVMALINSIIVASENIRDRVRIRNEFVALNILDVINCLRDENDGDLHVQLDVFEEELSADTEAMVESNKESIDINSHFDLFKAIYNKVNDTTLSLSLLSILYSLYQIDSNNPLCESTWQLIEKLSQQAVEGAVKADKLMEEAKAQRRHVDVAVQTMESLSTSSSAVSSSRLQRKSAILSGTRPEASAPSEFHPPPCPPPPPPLLGGYTPGPHPPPPLLGGFTPGAPPPPPPPPSVLGLKVPGAPPVPVPQLSPISIVNTIPTPEPNCQMKHFIWNKVPALQINKNSIWGDVSCMDGGIQIEYNKLEELFCAKISKEEAKTDDKVTKAHASPNEISLLDPKRSMNVNIFLKQFRKNNAAIVDLIRKGEARNIGVEKLKGLIKILPLMDEVEMIQNYDGDADKLGNAEKFFMQLISVPCYKLRLELMLLKSDFQNQLSSVRSNLLLLSGICRRLYNNTALKKFLRLVLIAGNFINKGSNAGDAVGFKICSLNKLILTKSNDPKLSLLHVLVQEAEAKDKDALAFTDDLLDDLQKASRFSLENVKSEFNQIKANVKKLLQQIQTQADDEIKDQFKEFLEEAEGDLSDIDESLELLVKQSHKLAHHFCENENSFNLEEFLSAFREFCDRVKVCQQ